MRCKRAANGIAAAAAVFSSAVTLTHSKFQPTQPILPGYAGSDVLKFQVLEFATTTTLPDDETIINSFISNSGIQCDSRNPTSHVAFGEGGRRIIGLGYMKIAIIPPTGKTGGWTSCRYLIRGLRHKDIDVKILRHFVLNTTHKRVFLGSLLLKRLMQDDSISLVHNVDNVGPFLLRHKDLRTKKVLTIHDIAPVMLPRLYERTVRDRILRWDFTTVLPRLMQNADLTIVDSHATKKDVTAKFRVEKKKLAVIHLGVDTSFFQPSHDCSKILNKYNLRRRFLLYVGADNVRKNLKTLIEAFISIFHEISEDLVLIGPLSENAIRDYINSCNIPLQLKKDAHKRIIVLGYVPYIELPCFYSGSTALIFPSLYEGFGLPPLEAMACNSPVVLSDNSSLREIAGSAGLYIDDPLNYESIAKNMLEVANNETLRERLKFRGYVQAQTFSWEKTVQKTIEAYNSIL